MPRLALLTLLILAPIAAAEEPHWAFQPVKRPAVPEVRGQRSEVRNEIDRFVLAKLQEKGLSFAAGGRSPHAHPPGEVRPAGPAADAGRGRGVRRTTSRPTPTRSSSTASSPVPHYGERWARHWLDLARYADTNGYEFDEPRPDAWRYRDYVIRSFNADKPFDRFILEQTRRRRGLPRRPRRAHRHRVQPARAGHDRLPPTRRSGGRTRSTT